MLPRSLWPGCLTTAEGGLVASKAAPASALHPAIREVLIKLCLILSRAAKVGLDLDGATLYSQAAATPRQRPWLDARDEQGPHAATRVRFAASYVGSAAPVRWRGQLTPDVAKGGTWAAGARPHL